MLLGDALPLELKIADLWYSVCPEVVGLYMELQNSRASPPLINAIIWKQGNTYVL